MLQYRGSDVKFRNFIIRENYVYLQFSIDDV